MNIESDQVTTLSRIGLSVGESRLYLLLLESGPASVAQLAKTLGTSRQAVYVTLPRLSVRGLIKQTPYGRRTLYEALPPSQLKVVAQEATEDIERLIPELALVDGRKGTLPSVAVYESPLAMREWYEMLLKSARRGDELLVWSTGDIGNWYELDRRYYQKFLERIHKRGVRQRVLVPEIPEATTHMESLGWSVEEYRKTPIFLSGKVDQYVWRDQVCYLTMGGVVTSLISLTSAPLAAYSRNVFETIWQASSPVVPEF